MGSCLELKVGNPSILKTGRLARHHLLLSWLLCRQPQGADRAQRTPAEAGSFRQRLQT